MRKFKKTLMLLLVIFGPISLFYFLSKGEYHFTKLPYLCDLPQGKPNSYQSFTLVDQDGKTLTQDDLKNKLVVVSYFDVNCLNNTCKFDRKLMRFVIYRELMNAAGFDDVIMISETNDSTPAKRKVLQEMLDVKAEKWKFVYSKDFSFFNAPINKHNPYLSKDKKFKDGMVYERSILILDKDLKIRGFFDASSNIEFPRVMEELRLLKKEYAKSKKVI